MALPKKFEGLEDGLTIAAEIVSAFTGIPVIGAIAAVVIKKLIEEFSTPTLKLKDVLNKKTIKSLGIPDSKFDSVFEQTRIALKSINSEDYDSSVFRKDIFTKNCFNPVTIADEAIVTLELDEEEKSDVLKAVRFALAVYLLRWTEEPDFPLETRQQLQSLVIATSKNRADIDKLINKQSNHETRITNLEKNRRNPIPAELTVIPKAITALIGRESVIQEITSRLETDHILCITADGGLGKTAIAKSIINSIRDNIGKEGCKFKYVAWIISSGNLKEDLLQINVPNSSSQNHEDKFIKACSFLQSNSTFLVIDNMDEPPTPGDTDILNTISGKSTTLITSRATIDFFSTYGLQTLDRDAAVALFYNHFFHNSDITSITHEKINEEISTERIDDIYRIIDAAGKNTLAIELIAKTAYAENLNTTVLWEKISSGIFGFESKTRILTDHSGKYPESKLSITDQICRLYSMLDLSDKQKEIMSFISLFPAEHDIFSDVFKWAGFFEQGANDMMYLVDIGWIVREDDYYSIHTIVRDSINIQNKKLGTVCSILDYEQLIEKLSNIYSYIPRTTEYNLAQKLSFVPQTVGKLLSETPTFSTITGGFYNNLACLYNNQGNYDEALKFFKMALVFCENMLGKAHPHTAKTYNNIGSIYKAKGEYDEAMKCYLIALAIREHILGNAHPDIATSYNNIGGLYQIQGNYDEALKFYKTALGIREYSLGKDHPSTATTYNNIGSVYQLQSNYNEALKYYNLALAIEENKLGKDHPSTATTYNNIAKLNRLQGNLDEALKFCKKALEIRKKTLGKNHPDTASTYNTIAGLYQEQGNYDEALKYYNLALEIRKSALSQNHPDTAMTYYNIGDLYHDKGDYDETLQYYNTALEICMNALETGHPYIIALYNSIALLYQEQIKYDDALKYYNMALEILEKKPGKDQTAFATTYYNLACLYHVQSNFDKAAKYYNLALEIQEKNLGTHPDTATTHEHLAVLYHKIGNCEEFLEHLEKAVRIRKLLSDE